jgi:hypothetical protein
MPIKIRPNVGTAPAAGRASEFILEERIFGERDRLRAVHRCISDVNQECVSRRLRFSARMPFTFRSGRGLITSVTLPDECRESPHKVVNHPDGSPSLWPFRKLLCCFD